MGDRFKQIPKQLMEFWNKYTNKQKTIIISVAAGIFLAIAILITFATKVQYEKLIACDTPKEASAIVDLLEAEQYKYKLSGNSTIVFVDRKKYSEALMLLGKNDVPKIGVTIEEVVNNSFSTTSDEKKMKYNVYLQDYLRQNLVSINGIKDAIVNVKAPEDDNTILSEKKDTSVSVTLTISDEFNSEMAETVANILAGAVGNETTERITIADQNGNTLFLGTNKNSLGGTVTSNNDFKNKLTVTQENRLYKALVKIPLYDDAEVTANLKFDMNKVKELYTQYLPLDGEENAVTKNQYTYKSRGANYSGGVPGTDSNGGDLDYQISDASNSDSSVQINKNEYEPNVKTTDTEYEIGAIIPEESSVAITLTSFRIYKEEDLKSQGELDNQTFDEFIAANDTPVKLEVDQEVYDIVKAATGIDVANIVISAWEQPVFQGKEKTSSNISNYIMIILAVLIIALLIFVVFKGMTPVEVTETEPELSVEQLLATTKENQSLEDIEFSEKSETRRMIEKFVDENPEAVALLLRNWLNDDWG